MSRRRTTTAGPGCASAHSSWAPRSAGDAVRTGTPKAVATAARSPPGSSTEVVWPKASSWYSRRIP